MTLERTQNISAGIFCILCGLFLIPAYVYTDTSDWGIHNNSNLIKIRSTLSRPPEISHDNKGNYEITLYLTQLPDFKFTNWGISYDATKAKKFCSDVTLSDTIEIGLANNEYQKKILKIKATNFFERLIYKQNNLSFYSLVLHNQQYVDINEINKGEDNNKSGWMTLFTACLSVGLIAFGIKNLRR